jgi:hypothetical protein
MIRAQFTIWGSIARRMLLQTKNSRDYVADFCGSGNRSLMRIGCPVAMD